MWGEAAGADRPPRWCTPCMVIPSGLYRSMILKMTTFPGCTTYQTSQARPAEAPSGALALCLLASRPFAYLRPPPQQAHTLTSVGRSTTEERILASWSIWALMSGSKPVGERKAAHAWSAPSPQPPLLESSASRPTLRPPPCPFIL